MKPRFRIPVKSAGLVAILIVLAGCENPYIQQFKQEFGWTEARMVSDGWLKGRPMPADHAYCYGTMGNVDCYASPVEGQEYRRITSGD